MNDSNLNLTITVRDFTLPDIVKQLEYLTSASDEYLHGLGVEPTVIRNLPDQSERMKAILATPVKDRVAHTFAVEIEGRLIGTVSAKDIKFGDSAEIHVHIFKLDDRHKGLASLLHLKVLKKVFDTFELKTLICEPTASNLPINAFLKKIGLNIIATYDTPPSGILRARTANRYEITRDFYLKIQRSSNDEN